MTLTDTEQIIVALVTTRFFKQGVATPRDRLVKKFRDLRALEQLEEYGFLYLVNGVYVPKPLAFACCGDVDILRIAKKSAEITLHVLLNMYEVEEVSRMYSFAEVEGHARRMYDALDEKTIRLGLFLLRDMGIFQSYAMNPTNTGIIGVQISEHIVEKEPSTFWENYVNQYARRFEIIATSAAEASVSLAPEQIVEDYSFHAEIRRVSEKLFTETYYRQAVIEAYIVVIDAVKKKSNLHEADGDDLMNHAFGFQEEKDQRPGHPPIVRFNGFRNRAERDEQKGIWFLFRGLAGLRNYKTHTITTLENPERAHEYLALASLLMRLLDIATVHPPGSQGPNPAHLC